MTRVVPNEDQVRTALRTVVDPEAGVDVVDLGLIYGIAIGAAGIRIDMTMTSPACPTAGLLRDEARAAVERIADGLPVEVVAVWDPPWEPDFMSDNAKRKLGW
ncbi:MAG: metal-sulfur cluster assembly factor [Sterolibacteriaceae bacterium MAG5]|nr:metal-sulfur cluster assembly factor [Candidatus Nitricoxidireducens bremensis]